MVGFGNSEKKLDFNYDLLDQVLIIDRLLDHLKIKKTIIVGHSFGGMIGTKLLENRKLDVSAFINLEGNLCLDDCGESINVANMNYLDFLPYYDSLKSRLLNSKTFAETFRGGSLDLIPPKVFFKTSQTIVKWSKNNKLNEIFENTTIPKLLIRGDKSNFKSYPQNVKITHSSIAGGTHFMILERPNQTYEAIHDYLFGNKLLG